MDTDPVVSPVPEAVEPASSSPRRGPVLALALAAGVTAGLLSWLAGEASYDFIRPAKEPVEMMGMTQIQPTSRTMSVADTRNAALAFGALGGLLGLALGAAGGLSSRSLRATGWGGLVGLVVGGAAGAGMAMLVGPLVFKLSSRPDLPAWLNPEGMILPMLIHGAAWCSIGAAGGLALAVGLGLGPRGLGRAMLGGLLGAALGTVLFEAVGARFFPLAQTTNLIATSSWARLLARVLVTTFAALGAAREAVAGLRPRR
jgi:hypothetical protein